MDKNKIPQYFLELHFKHLRIKNCLQDIKYVLISLYLNKNIYIVFPSFSFDENTRKK